MNDTLKLKGHGYFERRRKDGTVIDSWECDNTIVTAGLVQAAKILNGVSVAVFDTIAVGEGTTGVVVGNTALETERKRALATTSYLATGKAVFEKTFDFASGEDYDITEAGVLNNESAGGEMLDRFVFTAKAVDVDTDLYVKITITIA